MAYFPLSLIRRTVAALVAVAVVLAAPGRAAADCGDYVHIGTNAPTTPNEAPPARKPCDGPNCGNHTPAPAPTVPVAPTTHDDPAGALPDCPAENLRRWFAPADGDGQPLDFPRDVFRPPPL